MESGGDEAPVADITGHRSILIIYGSETGNAEDIAVNLGKMSERLHFAVSVDEMNDVSLSHLKMFTLVCFVTSTTGQGDIPVNAVKFWKSLLRKRLPPNALSQVHFTLFGLGDSSYLKFNWAARKLHKRLLQLGAKEVFAPGEGDERHDDGIDSIFLPWSQDFRTWLIANYPSSEPPIPEDEQLPPTYVLRLADTMQKQIKGDARANLDFRENCEKSAALSHIDRPRAREVQIDIDADRSSHRFAPKIKARQDDYNERQAMDRQRVDVLDKDNVLQDAPEKYLLHPADSGSPDEISSRDMLPIPYSYHATVEENMRITPVDHWQDVRLLSLTVYDRDGGDDSPGFDLTPGSTISIYPKNFRADVDMLIDRMKWQAVADKPLVWAHSHQVSDPTPAATNRHRMPKHLYPLKDSTLRDLLIHNFDITAVPKRSFIQEIAYFASDAREQERLRELVKPGNSQEFYDYTSRPRRTILELLQDFPSVMIPWDRGLFAFPIIRGREFSIANGGKRMTVSPKDEDGYVGWHVKIVVALVEYKTLIRKPRRGLCSRYIKYLPKQEDIVVTVQCANKRTGPPHQFEHAFRPLIAVATGTGIAPIRALIQERDCHQEEQLHRANVPLPKTMLFFGCRGTADYHFSDEWENMLSPVVVIPAFSREPLDPSLRAALAGTRPFNSVGLPSDAVTEAQGKLLPHYDSGKNYVQHYIRSHAEAICELIPENPIIAICGQSGAMPTSVRLAFLDAFILGGAAKTWAEAELIWQELNPWQETW